MSEQSTAARPFFQPRPECDDLQTAYLLWKIAGKVEVRESGCWEWAAGTNPRGYGSICLGRKRFGVHRLVYEACVAAVPADIHVLHQCDNPPCCRPDHLFTGTDHDNAMDCLKKGRNLEAFLTEDQVREIRRIAAMTDRPTYKAIGAQFGVSETTIKQTVYRRRWKHVQ